MSNVVVTYRVSIPAESDGGFSVINSLATCSLISIQNVLKYCIFRNISLVEEETIIGEEKLGNRRTPATDASTMDETSIFMMLNVRVETFRTNNIKIGREGATLTNATMRINRLHIA